MDKADALIGLVEGAARSVASELEESLPFGEWPQRLRESVAEALEAGFGPVVADVADMLVKARRDGLAN